MLRAQSCGMCPGHMLYVPSTVPPGASDLESSRKPLVESDILAAQRRLKTSVDDRGQRVPPTAIPWHDRMTVVSRDCHDCRGFYVLK